MCERKLIAKVSVTNNLRQRNIVVETRLKLSLVITCLIDPRIKSLRALIFHYSTESFDLLTAESGVGSSPTPDTQDKPKSCLLVCHGFFLGVFPFSPRLLIGLDYHKGFGCYDSHKSEIS